MIRYKHCNNLCIIYFDRIHSTSASPTLLTRETFFSRVWDCSTAQIWCCQTNRYKYVTGRRKPFKGKQETENGGKIRSLKLLEMWQLSQEKMKSLPENMSTCIIKYYSPKVKKYQMLQNEHKHDICVSSCSYFFLSYSSNMTDDWKGWGMWVWRVLQVGTYLAMYLISCY